MRYKNIIKPAVFLVGLVVSLVFFSFLFMPSEEKSPRKNIDGIAKEPQNTIDYLVIGDSEASCSISPLEIWKTYGFTGYNCGIPAQKLGDTYYLLENLLQNQSPKLILLETNSSCQRSSWIQEFQGFVNSVTKDNIPIYKYHDRWKNFDFSTLKSIMPKEESTDENTFKGFRYVTTVAPYTKGDYAKETKSITNIQAVELYYLNKIITLCEEKNIQLILFCAPTPISWSYSKHNSIAGFAKKNTLPFIDFNLLTEELNIDWSHDTRDKGDHLNFYGAQKITAYIGAFLSNQSGLADHRGKEEYAKWDDALNEYLAVTQEEN